MGFLDAIKRWRLASQGLSSGKKRRVHSENPVVQALEDSIWVKIALYATFVVASAVLVLKSSDGTAFANEPLKGALYGFIIAVTAIVMFQVSLQTSCRRNSRVVLVLGGLMGHLLTVRVMMGLVDSGAIPEVFRFFVVPFALAPMLHGVLLGRAVASFSAVYVTLIGCLLVPQPDVLSYMILSLVSGMTSVLLAYQVRKRIQLLQAGIYVGAVTLVAGLALGRLDIAACFGPDAMDHLQVLGTGSAAAFGTAVVTALLISGLLPLFEGTFHLTTDISWLELSDLNHKLLRRMQLEAPGTFHHSLVVAALVRSRRRENRCQRPDVPRLLVFPRRGKTQKARLFHRKPTRRRGKPPRHAHSHDELAHHHRPRQGRRRPRGEAQAQPPHHRRHPGASRRFPRRLFLPPRAGAEEDRDGKGGPAHRKPRGPADRRGEKFPLPRPASELA